MQSQTCGGSVIRVAHERNEFFLGVHCERGLAIEDRFAGHGDLWRSPIVSSMMSLVVNPGVVTLLRRRQMIL